MKKIKEVQEEKILCAAIWFDDRKEYMFQPININTGIVLCGYRHCCIFPQIGGLVGDRIKLGIYEKEQGFITNLNRFVSREEGLLIAINSKQVIKGETHNDKRLYSEDLY